MVREVNAGDQLLSMVRHPEKATESAPIRSGLEIEEVVLPYTGGTMILFCPSATNSAFMRIRSTRPFPSLKGWASDIRNSYKAALRKPPSRVFRRSRDQAASRRVCGSCQIPCQLARSDGRQQPTEGYRAKHRAIWHDTFLVACQYREIVPD